MHNALTPPPDQLLAEVEELLRTMPERGIDAATDDAYAWMGRAEAIMALVAPLETLTFSSALRGFSAASIPISRSGHRDVSVAIHKALYKLRIEVSGTGTTAKPLEKGEVFGYFDEVRKIVERARADIFFVDPYIDVDFLSRYLPQVRKGVSVRLLGRQNITALVPAVALARAELGLAIELRYAEGFHDRWVFVDGIECYYSGASFSAGAKKAPTLLAPLIDGLGPVKATYEDLWMSGTIK